MRPNHVANSNSWLRFGLTLVFVLSCVGAVSQGSVEQLLSAADKGDVRAIQAAIAAGADVEATDATGYTALMKAASGGKLEAVRALLKAGAKVNAKSKQGYTPLMVTVASGSVAVAKLLLDSGADVSATTPNGMTALDGAKRTGNLPLIQLLSKVTAPTDSAQAAPPPPPPPKTAISKQQIDAKTQQAAQAFKAGEYAKATALFQEVAAINPQDALVWHFLGQSLGKTNDVMGARRAFGKALEIQPDGQLADRTRDMLAKLPEPDLFTFKLGDGLTLGDWMPLAEKRAKTAQQADVLNEVNDYLGRFGPVPQLQRLKDGLVKEQEAQRDQAIQEFISSARVHDATSAQAALPRLHELRQQDPHNLSLMKAEAKACHLTSNFPCAVAAYSAWLIAAPGAQVGRSKIAEGLLLAKSQQPLEVNSSANELPAEIDEKTRQLLQASDAYRHWPKAEATALFIRTKDKHTVRRSAGDSTTYTEISMRLELLGAGVLRVRSQVHVSTSDTNGLKSSDSDTNGLKSSDGGNYSALGGLLFLSSDKKAISLTGTLFPLNSGQILVVKYEEPYLNTGHTITKSLSCRSGERILANSLHPSLSGNAYKVECRESDEIKAMNWKNESIRNDYFVESLGLFASVIGAGYKFECDEAPCVTTYFFPPKEGASVSSKFGEQSYGFQDIHEFGFVDLKVEGD